MKRQKAKFTKMNYLHSTHSVATVDKCSNNFKIASNKHTHTHTHTHDAQTHTKEYVQTHRKTL